MRSGLADWARLVVAPRVQMTLHPTFIGKRLRDDAWHNDAWLPLEQHHVFFVVDKGYCDLRFDEELLRIGPGEAFLLHPALGPAVDFSPTIHFHEFYLKLERGTQRLDHALDFCHVRQAWALSPLIEDIAVFQQQDPHSDLLRFSVAQCLLRFQELLGEQQSPLPRLSTAQCNQLMQWTRDHIHLSPEPRDIAQVLNLSLDYCSRIFKQRFGMSLRDWLIRERIQEAARRLHERSGRIEDIAEGLGFSNPAHFSRQFKKYMHCTASHWRKQR